MFPFEKLRYYNHMKVPLGIPSFKKRATVVIIINIKFILIVILSLLLLLLLLLLKLLLLLLLFGQKQAVGKFLRKLRAVVGRADHLRLLSSTSPLAPHTFHSLSFLRQSHHQLFVHCLTRKSHCSVFVGF